MSDFVPHSESGKVWIASRSLDMPKHRALHEDFSALGLEMPQLNRAIRGLVKITIGRITVTSVRTSNHIFLPEYQVSASNMPKVAGTSRTTFLSLPRELRQKILLEVFSQAESSRLIDQVTSNSIKQQKSISKQTTDEFWAIQERGWIVQSYFSTTFREPRQRLEEEFDFEIASMLAVLEAVHGLVKEDMEYIHRQWRAILELSLNAWCMDFRLQHRQLKGAGPGSNNWWWIPTWEDDNWYHMLLDSQPNIESHVR